MKKYLVLFLNIFLLENLHAEEDVLYWQQMRDTILVRQAETKNKIAELEANLKPLQEEYETALSARKSDRAFFSYTTGFVLAGLAFDTFIPILARSGISRPEALARLLGCAAFGFCLFTLASTITKARGPFFDTELERSDERDLLRIHWTPFALQFDKRWLPSYMNGDDFHPEPWPWSDSKLRLGNITNIVGRYIEESKAELDDPDSARRWNHKFEHLWNKLEEQFLPAAKAAQSKALNALDPQTINHGAAEAATNYWILKMQRDLLNRKAKQLELMLKASEKYLQDAELNAKNNCRGNFRGLR